jgi:hypothetical protein
MITQEECCCEEMYKAVSVTNEIPINVEQEKDERGLYRFDMEFVDDWDPEFMILLEEIPRDAVDFCPFCGTNISTCIVILKEDSFKWRKRDYICGSFRRWFNVDKNGACECAPTSMFKYEPEENKFYMHYRKGFGEGWIPITYCIYCGEPLAQMVEKHGIPKVIADRLHPSRWQGKYKLCEKKKVLTENDQLPDELSI